MIHWFKKHPNFLREESKRLAEDLNYKELYQERNNVFVSHGNIIVRLQKIHKFPILIIYTDATPYALPLIFPLKHELENSKVIALSKLELDDIGTLIENDIKLYPHLRHQNTSGALCTIEWDSLDQGAEFYVLTSLLKRIKDWFAGTITGNFPPDNIEVELYAHFNNRDETTKFMYNEVFLNEEITEGDCYSTIATSVRARVRAYSGRLCNGLTRAGIYKDYPAKVPIHKELKTDTDFIEKKQLVNNLIEGGILLKASWFHIDNEIQLFQTIDELITIIGNGSYDQGLVRFTDRAFDDIKPLPEFYYVGVRYPNRKKELEFQLFKLTKTKETGALLFAEKLDCIRSILPLYEKVEAIESEKFTEESFHLRNATRANRKQLKETTVNFLGVGALGSDMADTIGKAGVGNISLIDAQSFKAHNAIRHLAGFNHVGAPKVWATGQILLQHNPYLNITPIPIDVLYADIHSYIEQNTLSVSSIADDNVEGLLNEQAVIGKNDFFYVRALRGGKVGRIFRVIPGKDACLNCLTLYRTSGEHFITIPEDLNLPTLKTECNNPIRPASAADLKLIASLSSRIIIDHLQDGSSDMNHWLWTSEDVAGLQKNTLNSQYIPIHPQCQYCNHDQKLKVFINQKTLSFMRKLVDENNKIETGGVLAGFVNDKEGIITIDYASGPGSKAIQTTIKFEKDINYCQDYLDNLYKEHGCKAVYIGEWHSHPSTNNNPSGTDIQSLTEIAYQKEYVTDKPVMIILSNTGEPSCTIHPVGKTYYHTEIESYDR